MLALKLLEEIEPRLDKLAKLNGRTKSFYARKANIDQIADLKDLYLAEKRLEKNLNRKSETLSLASVEAELNLANRV
jgi:RHH-type rel operon transcriptional repressor/antitoxin RelB